MLGIALTDVDDLQFVTVEIERAVLKQAREHRGVGNLAGKAAVPVILQALVRCLEAGPVENLARSQATSTRQAFDQPAQPDPVVGMAVGDQNRGDALAEALGPVGQGVHLVEGDEGIDQHRVPLAGDQRAAHR